MFFPLMFGAVPDDKPLGYPASKGQGPGGKGDPGPGGKTGVRPPKPHDENCCKEEDGVEIVDMEHIRRIPPKIWRFLKTAELDCIKVDKVYNACRVQECPVFPLPVVPIPAPPAAAFTTCRVLSVTATGVIPALNRVVVTIRADVEVEFVDVTGAVRTVVQNIVIVRAFNKAGAIPNIGMQVQFEPDPPILECLDGTVILGGTAIELTLGLCFILKISLFVQLEGLFRFCRVEELCELAPAGCPEFLERCTATLDNPFPPQPTPTPDPNDA
ncbi:MAG: hypothetical protein HYY08_00755 [Firmicutes bacterium]|nr:hypothetical protein [Bacillota bacterium]